MANPKKLPFEVVLTEAALGAEAPLESVITSEAAWNALGLKAELPQVDFAKDTLLVVTSGRRPDTSYQLGISDVIDGSESLGAKIAFVLIEEVETGAGADMLSNPILVAKVANTGHHFVFARK